MLSPFNFPPQSEKRFDPHAALDDFIGTFFDIAQEADSRTELLPIEKFVLAVLSHHIYRLLAIVRQKADRPTPAEVDYKNIIEDYDPIIIHDYLTRRPNDTEIQDAIKVASLHAYLVRHLKLIK